MHIYMYTKRGYSHNQLYVTDLEGGGGGGGGAKIN